MKKYIIFTINLYILSLLELFKVYSKEILIKYQDNNWNSLKSVINNNQNDGEIILKFVDDYYLFKFENVPSFIEIPVNTNIKFIMGLFLIMMVKIIHLNFLLIELKNLL